MARDIATSHAGSIAAERGAFTRATTKPGKFEAAHGGTVFLDEVGELAPTTQAKLLRVLETKQLTRLGAVRDIEVDLRIVAATNLSLMQESIVGACLPSEPPLAVSPQRAQRSHGTWDASDANDGGFDRRLLPSHRWLQDGSFGPESTIRTGSFWRARTPTPCQATITKSASVVATAADRLRASRRSGSSARCGDPTLRAGANAVLRGERVYSSANISPRRPRARGRERGVAW